MGTKTENVDINTSMYEELIEKLATVEDSEEQARLVKEYYTAKIENAWWKGMGYPEGKIEVMRLKINTLTKARFKKEKAEAAKNGMLKFKFDGKVFPTGMTPAKVKKQEEERGKAAEKANPGLNQ